jgi:hypothetical protein
MKSVGSGDIDVCIRCVDARGGEQSALEVRLLRWVI